MKLICKEAKVVRFKADNICIDKFYRQTVYK